MQMCFYYYMEKAEREFGNAATDCIHSEIGAH